MTVCSFHAKAQNYNYIIRLLDSENGLPSTVITDITQDSKGIIWISTPKSIYQYDGYKFDEFQLSNQVIFIDKIFPENERFVWLLAGNPKQLIIFDIINNVQIPINELHPDIPFSPTDVTELHHTGDHECWIITKNRIFTYNTASGFSLKAIAPENLEFNLIRFIDNDGNFWVNFYRNLRDSTRLYIKETSLYFSNQGEQKANLIQDTVSFARSICVAKKATWVLGRSYNSTQAITRLYKGTQIDNKVFLKPEFGKLALVETKGTESSSDNQLLYAGNNLAWLLLKGEFLYLIDFEKGVQLYLTKEIKQFKHIYSLDKIDRYGNLWMTTEKGLVQIFLQKSSFEKILYENPLGNKSNKSIRGIIELNNSLWVCSYSGLFRIKNNGEQKQVGDFNYGIAASGNGYFYYFTDGKDRNLVYEMDTSTFGYRAIYPNIKMHSTFRSIYEDRAGTIWLGDIGKGLFYITNKRDSIYIYENKKLQNALKGKLVNQVTEHANYLWLATSAGVFQIDLKTRNFAQYNKTQGATTHIPVDNVNFIHPDKNNPNIFWLATNEGIVKWNTSTMEFLQLSKLNGLSDNTIHSIYGDNNNNLWISSNHGLMCVNKNTLSVRLYFEKDGITHDEFNFSSSFQADDGKLYFGGLNGITAFYPDSILNENKKSNTNIQIISCRILNFDRKTPEKIPVNDLVTNGLKLAANNVSFSITFSMLNFQNPKDNYYQYKIPGITNDWIDIGNEKSLTLSLPGGDYELHIHGKTNDEWTQEIVIPIKSKEYFYKTAWFYVMSGLFILTLTLLFFKKRTKNLRENNIKLENEVKNRTKQINEALVEKNILFKELHHRVKNNLTILKSLLYLQAKNTKIPEVKAILKESENRIHSMALIHENLFTHENNTIISLKPFVEQLLTQLIVSFDDTLHIDTEVSCQEIRLDMDKCIVLNFVINELVTNSCKYAFHDVDQAVIGLNIEENNHTIKVTYYDNGCGLPVGMNISSFNGFGFKLIQIMMEQFDTSIHYEKTDNFSIFEFSFVL